MSVEPQYRLSCGSFSSNGAWGSATDYILSMLIDLYPFTPEHISIVMAFDVYQEFISAFERRWQRPFTGKDSQCFGAMVVPDGHLENGRLEFRLVGTGRLLAYQTGWTA